MFGDLKTAAGQKALNEFLGDRSYIEGYEQLLVCYLIVVSWLNSSSSSGRG